MGNHTLLSMLSLSGLASFLVGNAYQAQMPGFAAMLGNGDPGIAYSVLLAADAAGALTAGFLLESQGLLNARPSTTFVLAGLWCVCLGGFALSGSYPLAIALLFAAGFLELAFGSMAQTLVQLNAPAQIRGRVIGVFYMASAGMRTFSGVTVGLAGDVIGIRGSLSISAAVLLTSVLVLFWWTRRDRLSA
jgi:MFS family permease